MVNLITFGLILSFEPTSVCSFYCVNDMGIKFYLCYASQCDTLLVDQGNVPLMSNSTQAHTHTQETGDVCNSKQLQVNLRELPQAKLIQAISIQYE